MSLYKTYFLLVFPFIFLTAQIAAPLKPRYQVQTEGDISMISNQILNFNRKENKNAASDTDTDIGIMNNLYTLEYVNIETNSEIFSSSSADFYVYNTDNIKILYAGLYWAGKYHSQQKKDEKEKNFSTVKLKLPWQKDYIDINGELIYDGNTGSFFRATAPYVMYADITELVKVNPFPFGTYKIANVKADLENIKGGGSAGWSIVFVYENNLGVTRSISTYDGLIGITVGDIDLHYKNFKFNSTKQNELKLLGLALEGDLSIKSDLLQFKTNKMENFVGLYTASRARDNFFNSTITIDDSFFVLRNPNHLNTYGYDAFSINIANKKNQYFNQDTDQITIRLKSNGDQFFMFFNAFCYTTEDDKPKIPDNNSDLSSHNNDLSSENIQTISKSNTQKTIENEATQNTTSNTQKSVVSIPQENSESDVTQNTTSNTQNIVASNEHENFESDIRSIIATKTQNNSTPAKKQDNSESSTQKTTTPNNSNSDNQKTSPTKNVPIKVLDKQLFVYEIIIQINADLKNKPK